MERDNRIVDLPQEEKGEGETPSSSFSLEGNTLKGNTKDSQLVLVLTPVLAHPLLLTVYTFTTNKKSFEKQVNICLSRNRCMCNGKKFNTSMSHNIDSFIILKQIQ